MLTFMNNSQNIEEHNKRGNESYKRSLQEHSHLTFREKKVQRMGLVRGKRVKSFNDISELISGEDSVNGTSLPEGGSYGNLRFYYFSLIFLT